MDYCFIVVNRDTQCNSFDAIDFWILNKYLTFALCRIIFQPYSNDYLTLRTFKYFYMVFFLCFSCNEILRYLFYIKEMQKVLIQMLFVNSDRFEFSKIYKSFCKLVMNDFEENGEHWSTDFKWEFSWAKRGL